jgi:hypothetical protein
MMLLLSALHRIAARRGEGLRPELIRLLQRAKADPEIESASIASKNLENRCLDQPGSDLARPDTDAMNEDGPFVLTDPT